MLREVAASVRLVVSLRAVAWAWSQPVVQAQMRRDPTLLHYSASIARSKCKNAFGVKTITVMLREVAASVRLVVSLRAVAWAWSQPAVQAQMRRDPTLLVLRLLFNGKGKGENSPPLEGWQAQPDGVVSIHNKTFYTTICRREQHTTINNSNANKTPLPIYTGQCSGWMAKRAALWTFLWCKATLRKSEALALTL